MCLVYVDQEVLSSLGEAPCLQSMGVLVGEEGKQGGVQHVGQCPACQGLRGRSGQALSVSPTAFCQHRCFPSPTLENRGRGGGNHDLTSQKQMPLLQKPVG